MNLVELPELQNIYIDESKVLHVDASDGVNRLEDVDKNIKEMKMELKQKKRNFEVEEENDKRDLGKVETFSSSSPTIFYLRLERIIS